MRSSITTRLKKLLGVNPSPTSFTYPATTTTTHGLNAFVVRPVLSILASSVQVRFTRFPQYYYYLYSSCLFCLSIPTLDLRWILSFSGLVSSRLIPRISFSNIRNALLLYSIENSHLPVPIPGMSLLLIPPDEPLSTAYTYCQLSVSHTCS